MTTFRSLSLSVLVSLTLLLPARAAKEGDRVPHVLLSTGTGERVALHGSLQGRASILIFYRGSWCPYCTKQLAALNERIADFAALGIHIVAISPDSPANVAALVEKHKPAFPVYSDSDMEAAKAFGLAFTVDADTLEKYRGYKIDLNAASGKPHNQLPHPALFLVDENGVIRKAHVNENYRERPPVDEVLKAARDYVDGRVLRHVVLLKFKDGADAATHARIDQALQEFTRTIDTVIDYEWGKDITGGAKTEGFTHALFVTFRNQAGLDVYGPHPAHQALIEVIRPQIDKLVVLDYHPSPR
jgi:peroxiredoxin